jgi:antirestriction protein ArdC/phage/plasmid primase-like uncharacterized protein
LQIARPEPTRERINAIKKAVAGALAAGLLIAISKIKEFKIMPAKNKSEIIAKTIIDGLKNGTAPWIKPWTPEQCIAPYNPVTGTRYKGVNFLYLATLGKPDPRWMTFKQAQQNGWQVKQGSRGTIIQFWKFGDKQDEKTDDQAENETKRERPLLRHYYVFNASDIEGIPELEKPEKNEEFTRHDRAENILQQSGARIDHVKGDKAAYYPLRDSIVLPEKEQFSTPDGYYATALHELGHWSGHESRLNRNISNVFGSRDYAREELRAEIASYMLGMQLGTGHDPGQHLAYVDSWVRDLEDHPNEVFRACADAEKIQSFILEFDQEQAQTREDVMVEQGAPYYVITDDSFVGLTKDGQLNGDVQAGEYAHFEDPATALQAAVEAKQIHAARLEESELYIYRVNPPDDLQQNPVLVTGTSQNMRTMWKENIGGEFPEKIVQDEIRAMPGMPEGQGNKLSGKLFISFYANQEIDAVGNINLELQQSLQRGTTIGVLRFENALEKSFSEKSKINLAELNKAGIDGVVFINGGKPVAAIATDKKQLYPGMYQAAKGLEKQYLCVPYEDKNKAKELGALWDKPAKTWFIPDGLDKKPFFKWQRGQSVTADNPQQQFADFIREMGGDLQGRVPEMDGKMHRIPEIGGQAGNKNIAYVGYLDDVPAGYVKNFRGAEQRWKLAGVMLTDADRVRLGKEGLEKKAQREKERQELYAQKARESQEITREFATATGQETYFTGKGISITNPGVKIDTKGNIVVPLVDVDGKQWSHQSLQTNGFKQFFKDSRLQGTFALIGAESVRDLKGEILLAEGYSTAATIHEVTGKPVVVSTTSNNLKHVATALRDRHPNQAIYIMADDDRYLIEQGKMNAGQVKAKEAAETVGGHVISPYFDGAKPDKSSTDFNDMARLQGKEAVRDYIQAKIDLARAGKKIGKELKQERETGALVER